MNESVQKQYLQIVKKVEEELPDFALKKHKLLLRTIKTMDLFNFMSNYQFSNKIEDTKYYVPFISQSLFISTQRFSEHLLKIIFVRDRSFAKYAYNFFLYDSNQKYLNYFIYICFPTLFNQFSSDEYSACAYKFITKYIEIEKNPTIEDDDVEEDYEEEEEEEEYSDMDSFQDPEIFLEKSELTSDALVLTYILHNFQFRHNLLETFHRKVFEYIKHEDLTFERKFRFLIQSFAINLSYLDNYQLQILNDWIKSSIPKTISLFKQIFIHLIDTWRYSPQFCSNNILGEVPDEPAEYSQKKEELEVNEAITSLNDFIIRYQYPNEPEDIKEIEKRDKVKEEFDLLFPKIDPNQSPYLQQPKLREVFSRGKDSILLSDYDAFLISWIIKQGNKREIIKSSNLIRNHEKQEEFASKESALRLFYVDIDLFSRYFKISDNIISDDKESKSKNSNNVYELCNSIFEQQRKKMSSIRLIEKQNESIQNSIDSIILKFSDTNFLNDQKYGMNFLIEQLKLVTMELVPQINTKLEDEIIKQFLNYLSSSDSKLSLEDRFNFYFTIINTEVKKLFDNFQLMKENKKNFTLFFENFDLFIYGQFLIDLNRNISIKNLPKSKQIRIKGNEISIPEEFKFISNALYLSLSFKAESDNSFSGFRLISLEKLSEYICAVIDNADEVIADEIDESDPEKIKNEVIARFILNSGANCKYVADSFAAIREIIGNAEKLNIKLNSNGVQKIIEFLDSLNEES